MEIFAAEVDESAQEILENYEEAAEERANAEELNYQTEKVMVAFPYGTPMETIETVVENEAVDYEVIDDGKYEIREDLPDYKKERLEVLKDIQEDIVILADVALEDTVSRAEERFEQYNCVEYATSNGYLEADGTVTNSVVEHGGTGTSVTTNDPNFNTNTQWNMNIIDVPRAWNSFVNLNQNFEIWVAVIDCGVQMNHPDLKGILMTEESVDVTQNNKKLSKCDDVQHKLGQYTGEHGTRVAGIIAAKANNSVLGAGVGSMGSNSYHRNTIKIMAIKCDDSVNQDRHIKISELDTAVDYAVENGAEVINISYSAEASSYGAEYAVLEKSIKNAIKAGVTVVCSAGNDATEEERYPAYFDGVIGVGAVNKDKELTGYNNESKAVDIVAPGGGDGLGGIFVLEPTTMNSKGYGYAYGTSYATPQVAATVAMMLNINYSLTPAQILTRLQNRSVESVQGILNDRVYPLLNTGKAVALTKAP